MTIVSSREFANHQQKYFNLALNEQVFVKNGKNMFQITYEPAIEEQVVLAPDGDLRRAITAEELLVGIREDIREMFRNGKQNKQ